jgi:hypothetical protein
MEYNHNRLNDRVAAVYRKVICKISIPFTQNDVYQELMFGNNVYLQSFLKGCLV